MSKLKKPSMAAGGRTRDPNRPNPGTYNKGGTKRRGPGSGAVGFKCGGKAKKMAKGGKTCCRGMGAATRGGNFSKDG